MGYGNKHELRDLSLPNHRMKLMDSIEKDLLEDQNVLALFYGGSVGTDNTDLYSDIDLRIVIRPEKLNEYITKKESRAKKWGSILFVEGTNAVSNYTVIHYECFIKVDVFYYHPADLRPSVWLKQIEVVKDTENIIGNIVEQSKELSYQPTYEEFHHWRTKFFAHLHEAYRRMMREEYYYALSCVDRLRLSMALAWNMEVGIQPNSFGDWPKYEGNRSHLAQWQQNHLKTWNCGRNQAEIKSVLKSIVNDFVRVHRSLSEKLGLQEQEEWVNKVTSMVL